MSQTDGIPWNQLGIVALTVAMITVSAFLLTALDVVCLLTGVLVILLMAWVTCTAARDFRDWWHQGSRGR